MTGPVSIPSSTRCTIAHTSSPLQSAHSGCVRLSAERGFGDRAGGDDETGPKSRFGERPIDLPADAFPISENKSDPLAHDVRPAAVQL